MTAAAKKVAYESVDVVRSMRERGFTPAEVGTVCLFAIIETFKETQMDLSEGQTALRHMFSLAVVMWKKVPVERYNEEFEAVENKLKCAGF